MAIALVKEGEVLADPAGGLLDENMQARRIDATTRRRWVTHARDDQNGWPHAWTGAGGRGAAGGGQRGDVAGRLDGLVGSLGNACSSWR